MDADLEQVLATAAATPNGLLKAAFVAGDLEKVAPLFANESTREHAEAVLQTWAASSDPLRKGMASAWLSAARNAVTSAGSAAASAAGRVGRAASVVANAGEKVTTAATDAYNTVERKGSQLGAAAGAKLLANAPKGRRIGAAVGSAASQVGVGAAGAGAVAAGAGALAGSEEEEDPTVPRVRQRRRAVSVG